MRCSTRFLRMSDFYDAMITAQKNFDPQKPVTFDHSSENPSKVAKPFPKKIIKFFLDSTHQQRRDTLSLLEMLQLMEFLSSEGRQKSTLEIELARRTLAKLKSYNYGCGTNLAILVYLQSLEDETAFSRFLVNADNVLRITNKKSMIKTMTNFDLADQELKNLCSYMHDNGIINKVTESPAENLEMAVFQLAKKIVKINQEKSPNQMQNNSQL